MRKHFYNALWWNSYGNGITTVTTTSTEIHGEATNCVYTSGEWVDLTVCISGVTALSQSHQPQSFISVLLFSLVGQYLLQNVIRSNLYNISGSVLSLLFSDNPFIFPSRVHGYILFSGKMLFHCQIAQLVSTVQMLLRLGLTISIIILLCITAILGGI